MKKILYTKPVYLFLLSLFFVFHGYTENYNYIPVKDALFLLLIYLVSSLVTTGLFWIFYRNFFKSNLVTFLLMGFYFFFGYIYDNLINLAPHHFISRYSTLVAAGFLSIFLVFVILFFWKKSLMKISGVLNIFLSLMLLVDAGWLISKVVTYKKFNDPGFNNQFTVCDTCSKPDIYYILTDLYAGEQELKEKLNFDNSAFGDALKKRGFRYLPNSKSNYNYTPFSAASTLQMEYLTNLQGSNTSQHDLSICYNIMKENRASRFLFEHGYQLENFSLFDIYNQPSPIKRTILPEKTKFITAQTLLHRLKNDVRFNLARFLGPAQKRKRLYLIKENNDKLYNKTAIIKPGKNDKPRFVYTHLMMPHYPYYFNKAGQPTAESELQDGKELNPAAYVEYLQYTNQQLLALIDTIFANSSKPPIIILLSDHGYREFTEPVDNKYYFMNLSAVYLPGGNYTLFYDSMSNINIFRTVFNTQFNQKFKLLKDSTFFIEP